jgi:hypothetical protein
MLRLAALCSCFLGLVIALGASGAHAQMSTSNCIVMGGGMVHCDTMDMTPPASPPPQRPIDCNNGQDAQIPLGNPYAGQSKARNFLGALGDAMIVTGGGCPRYLPRLQREQIARFRMQVGKLLADGDCKGAARFALENGALELGQSIMAACSPNSAQAGSVPLK